MKRVIFLLTVLLLNVTYAAAQKKDAIDFTQNNIIVKEDTILLNKLKGYLLNHPSVFTKDSSGNFVNFTKEELIEMYKERLVYSANLRFDTISPDKSVVGIYRFGFSGFNERPWLYFKYKNKIEFIDLNQEELRINKVLKRIRKFYGKYPFTEIEKVRMLKGTVEAIHQNVYEDFSW